MSFTVKTISINKIYLDNNNPRDEPIDNEAAIIENLVGKYNIRNLAKDIAQHGISPLDRTAVIVHPNVTGGYIIVEGNRRLCALKLLLDPDKASKDIDRKYFRSLIKDEPSTLSNTLESVVFDNREAARHWLELRHEGELNGVGTKAWGANQIARFNRQSDTSKPNPNILASTLLEYAFNAALISKEQMDNISLTTLTRYISNPVFRNTIGLTNSSTIEINVPKDQFNKALKRFLEDAASGSNPDVNSRSNRIEREAYAQKLRDENVAPHTKLDANESLSAKPQLATQTPANPNNTALKKNNRDPDKRQNVIPNDFKQNIDDAVLKRIFKELRTLDSHTYSFSAAYLVRAVIERLIKLFLQKRGLAYGAELHILCGNVADELEKKCGVQPRKLKVLRDMSSNNHSKLSPETLGAWVHGGLIPTRAELNRRWDSIQPILNILFDKIK